MRFNLNSKEEFDMPITTQFPPSISVANINGMNGFTVTDAGSTSVSEAGDVNADDRGYGSIVNGIGDVNADVIAAAVQAAMRSSSQTPSTKLAQKTIAESAEMREITSNVQQTV